jgi:hypothetical protein
MGWIGLGVVIQACNPSYAEGIGESQPKAGPKQKHKTLSKN